MPTGTQERKKRPTTVENITVLQVGEWGVRVGEKLWFGVNEPLTPSHFVPDTSYKVAVTVSHTGKKYISEIIGTEDKVPAEAAAPATQAAAPSDDVKAAEAALAKAKAEAVAKAAQAAAQAASAAKGTSAPLTKDGYWERKEAKDETVGMLRCRSAAFNAALQSPALAQWATNIDEYLALVRKAADTGVKYVNE